MNTQRRIRFAHTTFWVLIGLVVSWPALAANVSDVTITRILTYETYAVLDYVPASATKLGCTGTKANSRVIIDWAQSKNNKVKYSAALSAYLMGRSVGFGTKGCHKHGVSTPKAYRVEMAD